MTSPAARQIARAGLEHADRPAWLELRRQYVCASDAPQATATPGYGRTRWQLYIEKTTGVTAPVTERQAEQFRFGHRMEGVAAAEWRDRNPGARLARVGMLASRRYPWLACNLDRRVYECPDGDGPCAWECKNRWQGASREWDLDGDPDAIPDGPMLQAQAQLIVTGYSHLHLVVVIGGHELRPYRVDADEHLQKLLIDETRWFWYDCVQARHAPPIDATERTGQILARLWDVDPDKVRLADADALDRIAELRAAKRTAKAWKEEVDRLKHELEQRIADAEALTDPATGEQLITWKRNGTFREADFRDEQPGAFAEYAEPVLVTNTQRLEREDEKLYAAYRSRQLIIRKTTTEGSR
jgi:putative phage-type endonuclease